MELEDFFELEISGDGMTAALKQKQLKDYENDITEEQLAEFLKLHGIVFGIKPGIAGRLNEGPVSEKLLVAEGRPAVNGRDAAMQLVVKAPARKDVLNDSNSSVNFRDIIEIPSVQQGDTVAVKIEKTPGADGTDVYGREVTAREGRDFKLRPGKNTKVSRDSLKLIALSAGQPSPGNKTVHVYPVYEVHGDVSMKVGNIDFVGNVTINGGVPSGYSVKAKGDIRISGPVEGAEISAGGSVYISRGIVAQNKGFIKAGVDIFTSFINQAEAEAGGDIYVTQSILHSNISAGGFVRCIKGRGNIVGGSISAGKGIEMNEAGNSMNTPTTFFIGAGKNTFEKEKFYEEKLKKSAEELEKLHLLLEKLTEKEEKGAAGAKDRIMILRIRSTIEKASREYEESREELGELAEVSHNGTEGFLTVHKTIYPNSAIQFGKYRCKINSLHQHLIFKLEAGEIRFESVT